ncbi:MAG: hypothetical protein ABI780_12380, partial [Ardenticatenales bacterium]
ATADATVTGRPTPTLLPASEATSTPSGAAADGLVLPFAAYGRWRGPANVQTGIQIQNLSQDPAQIDVTFVDEDGADVASVDRTADPGAAPNVYAPTVLGAVAAMPSLFGVRAVADVAIGAIVRTDWFDDDGAGIAESPSPSRSVVVPSFVRRSAGRSSMLAIANAGTQTANVTATLFTGEDTSFQRTVTRLQLPVGTTRRLWADYEAAFQPLGPFEGWLRLDSDGPPLSVQAWEAGDDDAQRPRPVAAFEAQPLAYAASDLIAPLFRSAQRGVRPLDSLSTRIVVVNPGADDAEVTLSFSGADNAAASPLCRGGRFHQTPVVVPAGGRHVFRQAPGGGHDIPPNCFGTARISTANESERVLAVVYDATSTDGTTADALLSAFTAPAALRASRRVALPLIRRNHVGLSTGIQVVNAGPDPVDIVVDFSVTDARTGASRPVDGCTQCRATIDPDDSATFWPPSIAVLPDGVFGGAVITADGPIVALVNDYPTVERAGRRTDPATYLGLAMP